MKYISVVVSWLWNFLSKTIWEESEENLRINLDVRMECRGPDGKIKWSDVSHIEDRKAGWNFYGADLALILICLGLWGSCYFLPREVVELVSGASSMLMVGRVATAGLNKLLDATLKTGLASPAWYVGLMGAVASDGVTTNASTAFTSAGAAFVAGDQTRAFLAKGAGTSGADLNTTITTVTNGTTLVLGATAGASLTGVKYAIDCRVGDTMASHTSFVESTTYSNANRVTWTPGTVSAGSVDNSGSPAVFNINGTDDIFGAFLTDQNTKGGSTGTLFGAGVNSSGIVRHVLTGDTVSVTVTPSVTST